MKIVIQWGELSFGSGYINLVGSGRLLPGFFQVEGMSKFLAGGGGTPPIPPQYGKPCMVTKIGWVVTYYKGLPL